MGGLEYFVDPSRRVYWLYLLSSFLIAFIWLLFHKKRAKIVFSKTLWFHPSAKLDYLFFVLSFFIKILIIIPLIISAKSVAFFVMKMLIDTFGFFQALSLPYEAIITLFTCTLFVASDFSRYWLHRWLHTVPILWEIHKVHHSAKVLTPLTFYRVHPIENFLFGLRYALVIGVVSGVFLYLFGAKIGIVEVYGVNIFVFIFSLLGSNLRHSHVGLSYPAWLEYILISPKQHQMHHSTKYSRKNFGGYLALWDTIFGSVKTSYGVGYLKFGLKKSQMALYQDIGAILLVPLKNIKGKSYEKRDNFKYFSNMFYRWLCLCRTSTKTKRGR